MSGRRRRRLLHKMARGPRIPETTKELHFFLVRRQKQKIQDGKKAKESGKKARELILILSG